MNENRSWIKTTEVENTQEKLNERNMGWRKADFEIKQKHRIPRLKSEFWGGKKELRIWMKTRQFEWKQQKLNKNRIWMKTTKTNTQQKLNVKNTSWIKTHTTEVKWKQHKLNKNRILTFFPIILSFFSEFSD